MFWFFLCSNVFVFLHMFSHESAYQTKLFHHFFRMSDMSENSTASKSKSNTVTVVSIYNKLLLNKSASLTTQFLRPHFNSREITKAQYKYIKKRVVTKILKREKRIPVNHRIQRLVLDYVHFVKNCPDLCINDVNQLCPTCGK